MRDLTVGVNRPPNQGEELDQEFLGQLTEVVKAKDVGVMGDLNFPDICWEEQTARSERSRRFLARVQDLHLTQEIHSPTRGDALLDLVLATGDDLVRGCMCSTTWATAIIACWNSPSSASWQRHAVRQWP